ncbi:DUF6343 family protein [Phaeacidiphilus oryzae]|uniref:DUF6343 family protein n=1 Tax=Phaeacidiphilus oryzae TaxID=348818 RepID=UPI0007C718C5|nr:DUF6343 family protein [Phaeacidiphilus oryzae]
MTTPTHGSHRLRERTRPRTPSRAEGRRWSRTGTEPVTAMSDLPLRRALSRLFAPLFLAGTVAFSVLAADADAHSGYARTAYVAFAALCAAFAVLALADLVLVARRIRERSAWRGAGTGDDGGNRNDGNARNARNDGDDRNRSRRGARPR